MNTEGVMCCNVWLQDAVEVLITMGAMEAGSLRVLPLGLVARNVQVCRAFVRACACMYTHTNVWVHLCTYCCMCMSMRAWCAYGLVSTSTHFV